MTDRTRGLVTAITGCVTVGSEPTHDFIRLVRGIPAPGGAVQCFHEVKPSTEHSAGCDTRNAGVRCLVQGAATEYSGTTESRDALRAGHGIPREWKQFRHGIRHDVRTLRAGMNSRALVEPEESVLTCAPSGTRTHTGRILSQNPPVPPGDAQ